MDATVLRKGATYGLTGLLFILTLGIFTTFIGSQVGEGFKDISIITLGQGVSQVDSNPLLILVAVLYFIIIGFLVFVFGKYITPNLGKLFGLEVEEEQIEAKKKAYIITFLLTGFITVLIISGFNQFLQGINPQVNIIDLGTLTFAITVNTPEVWFVIVAGIIILGIIVSFFAKYINSFRDIVPDKLAGI